MASRIPVLPHKIAVCAALLLCVVVALGQLQDARQTRRWDTLSAGAARHMLARPLEQDGSAAYFKAYANAALAQPQPDFPSARTALSHLVDLIPDDPNAWNMLTFVETTANGFFTRNSVIALRNSYDAAPYGGFAMMMWRVDFASTHWTALSDDLQARTLAQIPVIARFGPSWEWRQAHCWDNPHEAIYRSICATTPGIPRKGQPIEDLTLTQ